MPYVEAESGSYLGCRSRYFCIQFLAKRPLGTLPRNLHLHWTGPLSLDGCKKVLCGTLPWVRWYEWKRCDALSSFNRCRSWSRKQRTCVRSPLGLVCSLPTILNSPSMQVRFLHLHRSAPHIHHHASVIWMQRIPTRLHDCSCNAHHSKWLLR